MTNWNLIEAQANRMLSLTNSNEILRDPKDYHYKTYQHLFCEASFSHAWFDCETSPSVDEIIENYENDLRHDKLLKVMHTIIPMVATEKQMKIWTMHCAGVVQKEIASQLNMSQPEVSKHLYSLYIGGNSVLSLARRVRVYLGLEEAMVPCIHTNSKPRTPDAQHRYEIQHRYAMSKKGKATAKRFADKYNKTEKRKEIRRKANKKYRDKKRGMR